MDLEEIRQLIKILEESNLKKLTVKKGDFEVGLEKEGEVVFQPMMAPPPAQRAFVEDSTAVSPQKEGTYVTSPMVGTFYASPAIGQPPFVKVGDRVEENTIVCIIEAMKVMNEVKAGVSGIVADVMTDNAEPVEFGTKLLRIR